MYLLHAPPPAPPPHTHTLTGICRGLHVGYVYLLAYMSPRCSPPTEIRRGATRRLQFVRLQFVRLQFVSLRIAPLQKPVGGYT